MEENVCNKHKKEPTKIWKEKREEKNKEECELVLYA